MNVGLAVVFGVGVGAWTYNKAMHNTNSTKNSLIIGGFVGLIAAFIFFTLVSLVFHR